MGVGPDSKKKKKPDAAPSKPVAAPKREAPKGTRLKSSSRFDYVVVSDSLEGLAPVGLKKPKAEPVDPATLPPTNPGEPLEIPSSPEEGLERRASRKRKEAEVAPPVPPVKIARPRIGKRGNLSVVAEKFSPGKNL